MPLKRQHSYTKSQGIYAPTIRYHNGKFYVIAMNVSNQSTFYVSADQAEGPWSEPIVIEGMAGFDPSLLFDDDGKVYLTAGAFPGFGPEGIIQAELDIQTGKLTSEVKFIWEGTGGSSPEGPHLYKINNLYYLVAAEGGTEYGHMATIARSKKPFGPFDSNPANPILSNRSTKLPIQATGHVDLVEANDGTWWAVFLGFRPVSSTKVHHLGRETNLGPVEWSEDGWPIIGNNGQAEVEHHAKSLPLGNPRPWEEKEEFDKKSLSPEWNFYRNPPQGSCSLTGRQGSLTLWGKFCTLNDHESPVFVGRRQQHFNCEISTLLEFLPNNEGEEAGLTVFMNETHHYEIAKTLKNGKPVIVFQRRVGSLSKLEKEIECDDTSVILKIKATETEFAFSYIKTTGEVEIMGSGETSLLSTQVAGGFTGLFFGLYATGNGTDSKEPAHFNYFQYIPLGD